MSGFRYFTPYQTALDTAGVTLPGALLYFYQSGTATPLATYADVALTQPNTNPVVADAGGLFPAIFLQTGIDYKVILTDQDGNQAWEADPVTGGGISVSVETVPNIAALRAIPVNSDLVGSIVYVRGYYTDNDGGQGNFICTNNNPGADDSGTIIWSSTTGFYFLRDTQGNPFSLKWFGAKGDGVTDDSIALQNWLNAIQNGYEGYIPAVTSFYMFSTALTHTNYITIRGEGYQSRLHYTGSGVALTLSLPRFSRIENFLLTGTASAVGGLWVQQAQDCYYDTSVVIANFTGPNAYCRRFSACFIGQVNGGGSRESTNGVICDTATFAGISLINAWKFDQHAMSGNSNIGLDFQSGFALLVTACDFSTTNIGIEIARGVTFPAQVRNFILQSNYFESTSACINVGRGASVPSCAVYGRIEGNYLVSTGDCIHFYNCSSVTVETQTMAGTNTIEANVDGTAWNSENVVIDNSAAGRTARIVTASNPNLIIISSIITVPVLVSQLPGAGQKGRRAYVTDATTLNFGSSPVGGGSVSAPVFDDGSIWRIG